jgi:AraC-like DNA-binding protein
MVDATRGVLYPTKLPSFTRIDAPPRVADLVGWFWIPEWDIAPGRSSRQELVAFPASNLVVESSGVEPSESGTPAIGAREVEPTETGVPEARALEVGLSGPSTHISHRDLTGRGWAVGALLRPAGVAGLVDDPGAHIDASTPIDAPDLAASVGAAMADPDDPERHSRAVEAFTDWLVDRVPAPNEEGLLANAMSDLLMSDPTVLRLDDAAQRLAVSPRTLQRLARRYIGVGPSALIRRRRLQDAAAQIRADPGADLSMIAADLGFTDHAHLTNDFRTVLAFTPSVYRGIVHATDDIPVR